MWSEQSGRWFAVLSILTIALLIAAAIVAERVGFFFGSDGAPRWLG